jgi:tetratricopeptide (TPR) repeat protein
MTARRVAVVVAVALHGCTPALREPPPVSALAPGTSGHATVDELLRAADAAWARRADPKQAETAQGLYLDAAAADERRVEPLLGAMRAIAFRVEREPDPADRAHLAEQEVQLGQWCQRRAPSSPACDYRLAIALGQQARERRSTGKDALGKMIALLRGATAVDPRLDAGGPHRVLALVLLRAPGWPIGPGDPEAALTEARQAVALFPDAPDNQLALAEALAKNDLQDNAREAYRRALALASDPHHASDPDAEKWRADADAGLKR